MRKFIKAIAIGLTIQSLALGQAPAYKTIYDANGRKVGQTREWRGMTQTIIKGRVVATQRGIEPYRHETQSKRSLSNGIGTSRSGPLVAPRANATRSSGKR